MNWDAIGAIAETLGAIGVITSLVYLAVQIRQNSKHIESSIYQTTNDVFVNFYATLAADKALANIWYDELVTGKVKAEHVAQANAALSMLFLAFENNYQHVRSGVVARDASALPGLTYLLSLDFVSNWLKHYGPSNLSKEYLQVLREMQSAQVPDT